MKRLKNTIGIIVLLFMASAAFGQSAIVELGDKVKPFSATADDGKVWKSKDVIGKKNLVVYFYPAAMTGGCTKQACAYRDSKEDLSSVDAEVIGVSGDDVINLELFKRAHDLNFILLSDSKGDIARAFGVPIKEGEKSIERELDGKLHTLTRGLTTARWTFIINKKGELVYKSTEVNAAEDSKAVLEVLSSMD